MQLTPIRLLCVLAVPFGLVVATAACGQVTGLSDDYLFDLQEDGGAGDATSDAVATTDGPKSDAASDAPKDTGLLGTSCSPTQTANTTLRIAQVNGAMGCKDCLASECCTDVDSCFNVNECKRALSCRLDCTTKTGVDRHSCFAACNSNSGGNSTPASYTNGVGACSASSCSGMTACAFQ